MFNRDSRLTVIELTLESADSVNFALELVVPNIHSGSYVAKIGTWVALPLTYLRVILF